jgi:hypothetical protein
MDDIFEHEIKFEYEDITLIPGSKKTFSIHDRFFNMGRFRETWDSSDLKRILGSFAEASIHRHKHLAGNPEKTELKIRK